MENQVIALATQKINKQNDRLGTILKKYWADGAKKREASGEQW